MKKNLFSLWLIVLAVIFTTNIRAQVTLGNTNGIPKPAEKFSAVEIISKGTGGLRLPQLSTSDRDKWTLSGVALANGLTIYNTDTKCVEYWNSKRWISMCDGTSQTTISPDACTNVAADGTGCDQTFTVTDPDCPNGPFTIAIVAGNDYASLIDVSEANGTFKIKFRENNSVTARSVMVRVTSSCTNQYKDFIFSQDGVDCSKYNYTVPTVSPAGSSLTLCTGGAVYLSVPVTTANLDKLIWTRNGVEVARGQSYYIATQIGTYNVSMGAIGCNTNAANERKITESGTAPGIIKTIVASNSGILCGTSGIVKLTAMGSPASVSWFHNGVLSSKTGTTINLSGSADQGEWFAAAGSAGCYSKNSNIINVTYEAGSGTPITVDNADVLVNGTAINVVDTFCQGGSLTLEVKNKQAGVTYTWYNGDIPIASPYTIPASQTSILLRMVATDNSGAACPAEASTTEKPITGGTAPAAPTINGSGVICGSNGADLSALPAVTGDYTYTWYEGSTKLPDTTQTITVKKTGTTYSATVTSTGGCVSPMGSKTTSTSVSDVPTLTWKTAPDPVNFGDVKVYVTNIDYDLNTTYSWSADGGAVVTPAGTSASVKFPATGTAGAKINLKVKATNACGTSAELPLEITVNNACPTPVVSVEGSATASTVVGSPVTLKVSLAPGTGNTPSYQWYKGTSPGGTAVGTNSATYVYTPTAIGTDNFYCVVTNGCAGNLTGTSPGFTVNVSANPADMALGAGTFSGPTCFDINKSNWGDNCGNQTDRALKATNFATDNVQQYVFTASATGTKTNLKFVVVDNDGVVQSSDANTVKVDGPVTNGQTVTLTVTYKNTLSNPGSIVWGKTTATAIKVQIYAIYNNGIKDVAVPLNVRLQDCACCGAKISPTVWKNFMCHNLGADQTLDPSKAAQGLIGDYYQYGQKTPISAGWIAIAAAYGAPADLWATNANLLKGVNDPCPAGFRVPTKAEWAGVVANNTFKKVDIWTGSGSTLKNILQVGTQLYLPLSGGFLGGSPTYVNTNAYYFASDSAPYNPSNSATFMMSYFTMYYNSSVPSATTSPMSKTNEGYSVRCIEQ
ncbi:hypothetical protein [Flavobacterium sp. 1355]|uniref:hypothetical protein n=1 Tax=Flavobacterium sp. 1355 TaxID=2806571 RepID=UPI001AE89E61|nr:hypothetical protein [Flavobacterium sp. 1355]MBP1225538.1 uncharacterized protein (TIGR02145 family) [Flavobacterium sp. 1355]